MDNYILSLPDNHPSRLLTNYVLNLLIKNENVLVGGVHGSGGKTFLSVFSSVIESAKCFTSITFVPSDNPDFEHITHLKDQLGKHLVIIDSFELFNLKTHFLEKLQRFRLPHKNFVCLATTDHTLVTRPSDYFAISSPFFSHSVVITPFTLEQTRQLIETNATFYGWRVPSDLVPTIHTMSGGIPRLTKHIAKRISESGFSVQKEYWAKYFLDPVILFEMQLLAKTISTSSKVHLETLGLTEHGQLKSLLFSLYLRSDYDRTVREYLPSLTYLERKLFALLQQNLNSLVTLDQIGDVFELLGHDFSPWAIYKLVSRLKPKIALQFELKALKNQGYILTALSTTQ